MYLACYCVPGTLAPQIPQRIIPRTTRNISVPNTGRNPAKSSAISIQTSAASQSYPVRSLSHSINTNTIYVSAKRHDRYLCRWRNLLRRHRYHPVLWVTLACAIPSYILTRARTTALIPSGPRPCYSSVEVATLSGGCGIASWCIKWYFLAHSCPRFPPICTDDQ